MKATRRGNVRDFCEKWGGRYEFMVLLDADSLMTGETILRLVRTMHTNPRIGVLQTIMVAAPMPSFFAPGFEFGHRLGMLCSAVGAVWWQGDRCQFWGHNAIIRLAPFIEFCFLKPLTRQETVEPAHHLPRPDRSVAHATRRLRDPRITRRERQLRGDAANLDRIHGSPLSLVSRQPEKSQVIEAIEITGDELLPFAGSGARISPRSSAAVIFVLLAAAKAAMWQNEAEFPVHAGLALYVAVFAVFLTPRLAGMLHTLLSGASRYGGNRAVIFGEFTEVCFSLIVLPISMFATTWFFARSFYRDGKYEWRRRAAAAIHYAGAGRWQDFGPTFCSLLRWLSFLRGRPPVRCCGSRRFCSGFWSPYRLHC